MTAKLIGLAALFTMQAAFFIGIGAVGGHWEGTAHAYEILIGSMQQQVQITMDRGKK